jgi:hypothetical protein
MSGSGNNRAGLGWAILVVALAVPCVLFYNWWANLKTDREKALASRVRGRVPEGGVFQSSPNTRLVNPMAASSEAVSAETARAPVEEKLAAAVTAPVSEAAITQTAPVAIEGAPAAAFVAPPLKRDPTLSPADLVRLAMEEDSNRRAKEDLADLRKAKRTGKARAVKTAQPQAAVQLQGIISTPERGYKAIVNNEVVGAGEFVRGTKIRVVGISDFKVTFDYMGKRFSKGVSRD